MTSNPIQYSYPVLPPHPTHFSSKGPKSFAKGSQASQVSFSPTFAGSYLSPQSPAQISAQAYFTGHIGSSFASSSGHGSGSHSGIGNGYETSVNSNYSSPQPWFFDSGATNHVTNNLQNLEISQPVHGTEGVLVGNGTSLQVTHW